MLHVAFWILKELQDHLRRKHSLTKICGHVAENAIEALPKIQTCGDEARHDDDRALEFDAGSVEENSGTIAFLDLHSRRIEHHADVADFLLFLEGSDSDADEDDKRPKSFFRRHLDEESDQEIPNGNGRREKFQGESVLVEFS